MTEIQWLQTQIDQLRRRALGLDAGESDAQRVAAAVALHGALQQQLAQFTDAQALFSSVGVRTSCSIQLEQRLGDCVLIATLSVSLLQTAQVISPIGVTIRLGRDRSERLATLSAIRDKKMRVAQSFLARRCGADGLSSRKPRTEEQRFETLDGDFFAVRFSISQFRGARSVRQVFDILHFYNRNIEISASEKLGNITIREDDDIHEESIFQNRLVGANGSNRVLVESNTVLFAECVDHADSDKKNTSDGGDGSPEVGSDSGSSGEGHALLAAEFVDEDELYPYRPDQRVRIDHSTIMKLTSYMQPAVNDVADEEAKGGKQELVVVLTRWSHSRLHRPEFPISNVAMHELREGMSKWFEAMHRTLYEALQPDCAS